VVLLDTWWKVSLLIGSLGVLRVGAHYAHFLGERARREVIEFLDSALIALVLVFCLIRPFLVQAFFIPSESMLPTLAKKDRILVNKLIYRVREPRRGEVVVFRAPPIASPGARKEFIKRLVALEGDTVEVKFDPKTGHNRLFVNGRAVQEPYLAEEMNYEFPKITVPPGKVFVMGDNRNDSNDSHRWGPLPRDNLEGKAMFIFWPPGRIGLIR